MAFLVKLEILFFVTPLCICIQLGSMPKCIIDISEKGLEYKFLFVLLQGLFKHDQDNGNWISYVLPISDQTHPSHPPIGFHTFKTHPLLKYWRDNHFVNFKHLLSMHCEEFKWNSRIQYYNSWILNSSD